MKGIQLQRSLTIRRASERNVLASLMSLRAAAFALWRRSNLLFTWQNVVIGRLLRRGEHPPRNDIFNLWMGF